MGNWIDLAQDRDQIWVLPAPRRYTYFEVVVGLAC
jgi:hypothetical protein